MEPEETAGPDPDPDPEQKSERESELEKRKRNTLKTLFKSHRDIVLLVIGSVFGIPLGIASSFIFQWMITDDHIDHVAFDGFRVGAYNKQGTPIWERVMRTEVNDAILVNDTVTGTQYVAVACKEWPPVDRLINNSRSGDIVMLEGDGQSLWTYTLSDSCLYDTKERKFFGFRAHHLVPIRSRGRLCVAVLFNNTPWYPSALVLLDVKGKPDSRSKKETGIYWNPGLGDALMRMRLVGSEKEYLIWYAVCNNRLSENSPEAFGEKDSIPPPKYARTVLCFDPDSISGDGPIELNEDRKGFQSSTNSGSELWIATNGIGEWHDSEAAAYVYANEDSTATVLQINSNVFSMELRESKDGKLEIVKSNVNVLYRNAPMRRPDPGYQVWHQK